MITTRGLACWAIYFVLVGLMMCPGPAVAQRAIPDDNLAYPVLVMLTDCTVKGQPQGTAFFLDNGTRLFLVTARHVLFNESIPSRPLLCKQAHLLSYSRDPKSAERNEVTLDLDKLNKTGKIKAHSTYDVAVIHVADVTDSNRQVSGVENNNSEVLRTVDGAQVQHISPTGILTAHTKLTKRFEEVLVGNEVYVFGFPSSIGLREIPQIDYLKPLIKKGLIAGTNQANKTIIIDCLVFQGNSGGPVLQVEHTLLETTFRIVGVISQFVPNAELWQNNALNYTNVQIYNSGYAVAVPLDPVLEMIK